MDFYPRSPCGERLVDALILANTMLFLSTLSLRRATENALRQIINRCISIHALLAESDCVGFCLDVKAEFLSTLSLRRATYLVNTYHRIFGISIHALLAESDRRHRGNNGSPVHFYPRSPCGERPLTSKQNPTQKRISIHALLAESDRTQSASLSA